MADYQEYIHRHSISLLRILAAQAWNLTLIFVLSPVVLTHHPSPALATTDREIPQDYAPTDDDSELLYPADDHEDTNSQGTQDSVLCRLFFCPDDQTRTEDLTAVVRSYPSLSTSSFTLSTGVHLHYGIYGADKDFYQPPPEIIVFLQGRGGWLAKYFNIFTQIYNDLQIPILVIDHPGQGASSGIRGHINSYDEYSLALTELLTELFPHEPELNIFSHSTGGLIALYGTAKGHFTPAKMALISPLLLMRSDPVPRYLARPISFIASHIGLSQYRSGVKGEEERPFPENRLTSDPDKFLIIKNHSYPIPSPSMGWIYSTFAAQGLINSPEVIEELPSEVIIFEAEHEGVVDPEGITQWIDKAQSIHSTDRIKHHYVPYGKHDLLYEKEPIPSRIVQQLIEFFSS